MGATVTVGGFSVTTDARGVFEFRNKSMSQNNAHVKVVKTGYFNGNRSLMTNAGKTQLVRIKLLPKTITGTVSATSGGTVSLSSNGKVVFPANAFVDASGAAYNGTVNVAMAWINPTANDLGQTVQGDLRGINTAGGERALETYGMLGVEITNTSGQQLKIASGKTAEIRMPIPASLQSAAPTTIPLWNFDEATGRWKEEGSATKTGAEYVGTVKHFSFWNCDVPANFVNLCVTVLSPSGTPLVNVPVRVRKASSPAVSATGYTDSTGTNCGAVFKNEALILEVLDRCGNVVYTQNIGPYSTNASLTVNATIPAANTLTLTGSVVNCSNAAVTSGSVLVTTSGGHNYSVPVSASGTYSITILNCASTTINYSIIAIDNATLQQSAAVSGSATSGSVAVGSLQACGTSAAEYIQATIDGVPYSWVKPIDSVGAWSTGQPLPPYSFAASVFGNRSTAGTTGNSVSIGFSYNASVGSYPISTSFVAYGVAPNFNTSQQINSASPQVNLTTVGAPLTGFLEGNASYTMLFNPGSVTRNVYLNFRVRRP
jgi:hypothetical protein